MLTGRAREAFDGGVRNVEGAVMRASGKSTITKAKLFFDQIAPIVSTFDSDEAAVLLFGLANICAQRKGEENGDVQ